MKKFIVYSDVVKIFSEEKDLIKYLAGEKSKQINLGGKFVSKLENIQIETVEIEVLESNIASNYLESYIETSNRNLKLNTVLGDEFATKIEKFKKLFLEFAKDDILKKRFLDQLETTPLEKKSLSKLISGWVGYLFSVNDSVEWFRTILDIHNFRKIEDSYIREIFYSNGTSRYLNVKTNESAKENFLKAKSL
jgi:hypothetical protein